MSKYLAVLMGTAILASASSSPRAREASPPEACAVIQAIFSATPGLPPDGYPTGIQPYEPHALAGDVGSHLMNLGLSEAEAADLLERARLHKFAPYVPSCDWRGRPVSISNENGGQVAAGFTDPLFSSNGRLALVEWSMNFGPRASSGDVCLARKTAGGWKVRCELAWVS